MVKVSGFRGRGFGFIMSPRVQDKLNPRVEDQG